jgi:hypothetical protein
MMRFTGASGSATYVRGKLVTSDPLLERAVQVAVSEGWEVTFAYWAPVTASLDSDWSAYLTIGHYWLALYNEVPTVSGVPEAPGGYEEEGP